MLNGYARALFFFFFFFFLYDSRSSDLLTDGAAFVHGHVAVLQRGKLAERVLRAGFEFSRRFLVHALGKMERVWLAEFFEEPCGSDAARRLQEPEGDWRHVFLSFYLIVFQEAGEWSVKWACRLSCASGSLGGRSITLISWGGRGGIWF